MTLMYSGITDADFCEAIRDTCHPKLHGYSTTLQIAERLETEDRISVGCRLASMERKGLVLAKRCRCCGEKSKPVSYALRDPGLDLLD